VSWCVRVMRVWPEDVAAQLAGLKVIYALGKGHADNRQAMTEVRSGGGGMVMVVVMIRGRQERG
jgi:hypothetical protein